MTRPHTTTLCILLSGLVAHSSASADALGVCLRDMLFGQQPGCEPFTPRQALGLNDLLSSESMCLQEQRLAPRDSQGDSGLEMVIPAGGGLINISDLTGVGSSSSSSNSNSNSNSNGNGNIGGSSQNTNPAVSSTSSSTSAKETSNTSTKSQTTSASAPAETTSKSTAGSAVAGTTGTYSQEPSDFAYTCKSEFVDFSKSDAMSKFSFVWCPQNAYQTDNSVVWRLTPECGTTMVYPWDFHYGKIEARIRIGPGSGVVTAMILMGPPPADEIDFEWVGKDLTHVQTMYYVQSHRIDNIPRVYGVDQQGQGDLSTTFQNYAIELKEDTVTWFLNGEALPFVLKRDSRGFPTYANRARLGIWDGTQTSGWAGTVDWSQGPFTAEMMWFNFTPYC